MSSERQRGPGRPRDVDLEDRVYDAVLEVYWETSWRGFTFDAVARRAKVGRAALYRRWESKEHLLVEALEARSPLSTPIDTGTVRGDLLELSRQLSDGYAELSGLVSLRVALDAMVNPDLLSHLTDTLNRSRVVTTRQIVQRAIGRGELPEGTSTTLLLELVTGAILTRALFSQAHVDARKSDPTHHSTRIVDTVLRSLGAAPA
ncbi:TetR/AcrR family transcriptional regulator [Rhodococcus sp. IEGM 1330]|uniref:TetR/AcrR family transcriptional regulator n=1 Tax=Rhodococcus sp. IEGM 1330 TaxID=3082225 RepID=UPI002952A994|nr:TetR/AcrR family transcriptional regulator [Rhodococcus sp. IEGM 1330]MDV8020937.1 TetR/AcrR family transcriptional regulator [Rhodococcus sp. IEGM 1330]